MIHQLTDENFILFAAKNYNNSNCLETPEFFDDLKRLKYLKKHFSKYRESGELKERLILNHIIILFNVFEREATIKMLYFKLRDYLEYLKPFLILLNMDVEAVHGIGTKNETIRDVDIEPDVMVMNLLKDI
jgi:hypothetical protein